MEEKIYHEQIADQLFCDRIMEPSQQVAREVVTFWSDYLKENEKKPRWMDFADGSDSTKIYEAYNIFLNHRPGFTTLYEKIVNSFKEKVDNPKRYAISGWVNVYNGGGFLDWHTHGVGNGGYFDGRWHGYFCVNAEPSKTLYRNNETHKLIKAVENRNGWLTMSPGGHQHRTTPWEDQEKPRITIAFDICLRNQISIGNYNHWIPII